MLLNGTLCIMQYPFFLCMDAFKTKMHRSFALYNFICSGNHTYINIVQSFQCLKVELQSKIWNTSANTMQIPHVQSNNLWQQSLYLCQNYSKQVTHSILPWNSYKFTQKYRNSDNQADQEFVNLPNTLLMKSTFCTFITKCFKKKVFVTNIFWQKLKS